MYTTGLASRKTLIPLRQSCCYLHRHGCLLGPPSASNAASPRLMDTNHPPVPPSPLSQHGDELRSACNASAGTAATGSVTVSTISKEINELLCSVSRHRQLQAPSFNSRALPLYPPSLPLRLSTHLQKVALSRSLSCDFKRLDSKNAHRSSISNHQEIKMG